MRYHYTYLFQFVSRMNSIDVNVEAHVASQTLHSDEALQLDVACHYVFGRDDLCLVEIGPFADAKLHDARLQKLNLGG